MPIVDGKTLIGWGTVRDAPWHFAGLFVTQQEAQLKADELGDGYVVRYGERQDSPDSFTTGDAPVFTAIAGSIFEPLPTGDNQSNRLDVIARWINKRIARLHRVDK